MAARTRGGPAVPGFLRFLHFLRFLAVPGSFAIPTAHGAAPERTDPRRTVASKSIRPFVAPAVTVATTRNRPPNQA
jgi:hypothetical protein